MTCALYERPVKAINNINEIKVGEKLWYIGIEFKHISQIEVVKAPAVYRDHFKKEAEFCGSSLGNTYWFTAKDEKGFDTDYSCNDCSVGADYNSWYLFHNEEDALEALANKVMIRPRVNDAPWYFDDYEYDMED